MGTRGDVQPYAVLGQALAERGHDVILSTAKNFEELIVGYGLKFHPVDVDYEEILNSKEGRKILQVNIFAIQRNLDKHIYPLIKKSLNEFYKLAQTSDLVIYRPKTMADVFTQQLNVKAISAAVIPAMEETAAFFNPMFSSLNLPSFLNRWSYKLNKFRYSLLHTPINEFRIQNGLHSHKIKNVNVPCIYGISPSFLERPPDWPKDQYLTGFWFPKNTSIVDPDTLDFVENGKPPILVTFGSMPFKKDISSLINYAVQQLDERFIIVKGWGNWNDSNLISDRIKIVPTTNFEALFPKVKAIIHHGGIGTIAECLRAGKPMLICPVLFPVGDHSFWADLVYKRGLGVIPVPLSRISADVFVEKIREMVSDEQLYINAAAMAEKINAENGLQKAVEVIENICVDQRELQLTSLLH